MRLEIFRARQRADRAAQALGYAIHRARKDGREIVADELERLHAAIESAELEIARLESQLGDLRAQTRADSPPTTNPPATV